MLLGLCLLGAAIPGPASATQVVWGQVTFTGNNSLDVGVAYLDTARVKGRMTTIDDNGTAGDQVGGGPLCQLEFVRNGPQQNDFLLFRQQCIAVPAGARTFPFEFEVGPGPSRSIGYLYFDNGDGQFDGSPDTLHFNVAYRTQLYPQEKVVHNGEQVKFVGAIPAWFYQPPPLMALQVRTGKKWRTFKTLHVDNTGEYVGVYRFTNTRSRSVYKFRVKPIPNGSYPIVLHPSPKAKVIVKP